MTWEDVPHVLSALVVVLTTGLGLLNRGSRARARIHRDLEIAQLLPDGPAKQQLVDSAAQRTLRLLYRDRRDLWLDDAVWAAYAAAVAVAVGSLVALLVGGRSWSDLTKNLLVAGIVITTAGATIAIRRAARRESAVRAASAV